MVTSPARPRCWTNVGLGATAAGVGATALLFALRHRHADAPALTVALSHDGAGLTFVRSW